MDTNADLAERIARFRDEHPVPIASRTWYFEADHGPLTKHLEFVATAPSHNPSYAASALQHARRATALTLTSGVDSTGRMTDPSALWNVGAALNQLRNAHHVQFSAALGTEFFGLLVAAAFDVVAPRPENMVAAPRRVTGTALALPAPIEILVMEPDDLRAAARMDRLVNAWFGDGANWTPVTVSPGLCADSGCRHNQAEHAVLAVDDLPDDFDDLLGGCRRGGCTCPSFITAAEARRRTLPSTPSISN